MKALDEVDLLATVSKKFSKLDIPLISGGEIEPIEPRSIDVGAEASNRNSYVNIDDYTSVNQANPANASSTELSSTSKTK